MMCSVLEATDKKNGRRCKLPHRVMLWVVLAMGLFTHMPIRQVFSFSRRLRRRGVSCRSGCVRVVSDWEWNP